MSFFAASIPPLQCHFNELEINFQSTTKTFEFIPVKDNYQRDSVSTRGVSVRVINLLLLLKCSHQNFSSSAFHNNYLLSLLGRKVLARSLSRMNSSSRKVINLMKKHTLELVALSSSSAVDCLRFGVVYIT